MRLGIMVLRAILAVVLGVCLMIQAGQGGRWRRISGGGLGDSRDIGMGFPGQRPHTVCLVEYWDGGRTPSTTCRRRG